MSDKKIDISENISLWINANGKYGISSGGQETVITAAEFNALALRAPVAQQLTEALEYAIEWLENINPEDVGSCMPCSDKSLYYLRAALAAATRQNGEQQCQ